MHTQDAYSKLSGMQWSQPEGSHCRWERSGFDADYGKLSQQLQTVSAEVDAVVSGIDVAQTAERHAAAETEVLKSQGDSEQVQHLHHACLTLAHQQPLFCWQSGCTAAWAAWYSAFLVHTKCCPALSRSHPASSEQDHRNLALRAHTTHVQSWQLMPHGLYQPSAMHAFGVPAQLYQALTWPLLMCDQIHILHLARLTPHIWLEQCLSECLGGL